MPCCRHNSAVANPASPCFRIVMICSSLCRVPFTSLLLSTQNVTLANTASVTTLVQENSHSRWSSFWGLGQNERTRTEKLAATMRQGQKLERLCARSAQGV